jgi:hypothetical protein
MWLEDSSRVLVVSRQHDAPRYSALGASAASRRRRKAVGHFSPTGRLSDVGTVVLGATVVSGSVERGRLVVIVVPGGSNTMVAGDGGATVVVGFGAGGGSCGDAAGASGL